MTVAFSLSWWVVLLIVSAVLLIVGMALASRNGTGAYGMGFEPGALFGCLLILAIPIIWIGVLLGRWLH